MGAGWGRLSLDKHGVRAWVGCGLGARRGARATQPRSGFRRGLSNRSVGVPCDSGTVHKGLPLRACKVAAPDRATRPRPTQALLGMKFPSTTWVRHMRTGGSAEAWEVEFEGIRIT